LKVKRPILLLPSIGVILAGLILIMTPITSIFIYMTVGTIPGMIMILLFTVAGAWEISLSRTIAGTQVGEWPGLTRALVVLLLLRVVSLYYTEDLAYTLNLVALGLELLALALVFVYRPAFMPSEEEVAASLRRLSSGGLKTAAQCPKCSTVVEADWTLCPDCGTRLPKFCAKCGTEIQEGDLACCSCGMTVEVPASLLQTVDTLRMTAEQEAAPETRSARYARLGDGLLKIGRLDEAIEAFKTAIHYTQFDRKRTNFMVKMAVVMANKGRLDEADQLLDSAMALDPQDVAGAARLKEELRKEPVCPA